MNSDWYAIDHLPFGRVHVRVADRSRIFAAARSWNAETKGWRWCEVREAEREAKWMPKDWQPLRWQPLDAANWVWPNGAQPPRPLPKSVPRLATLAMRYDETSKALAAEFEEERERLRVERAEQDGVEDTPSVQWWRDVTKIEYQPRGRVTRAMAEARLLRALILADRIPDDLRRYKSIAAAVAERKADVKYVEASDDYVPPLVPLEEDQRDFDTVMGWLIERPPSSDEWKLLHGRKLSPPERWAMLGARTQTSGADAKRRYGRLIGFITIAANRPPVRRAAAIAALRERNRMARNR